MPKQIIILVCIAFLATCSDKQRYKNYQELRHPDGFVVRIPLSMKVEQTPHGYIVRDPTIRRYTIEASVERIATIATDGAPKLAKRKKAGGRSVSYQIDKINEGGSGGAIYELRILWVNEGGAFLYSQQGQAEYGEPSFELCWDLVKTTELVHRK